MNEPNGKGIHVSFYGGCVGMMTNWIVGVGSEVFEGTHRSAGLLPFFSIFPEVWLELQQMIVQR